MRFLETAPAVSHSASESVILLPLGSVCPESLTVNRELLLFCTRIVCDMIGCQSTDPWCLQRVYNRVSLVPLNSPSRGCTKDVHFSQQGTIIRVCRIYPTFLRAIIIK